MGIDQKQINAAAINEGGVLSGFATASATAAASIVATATYVVLAASSASASALFEGDVKQRHSPSINVVGTATIQASPGLEKLGTASNTGRATITANALISTDAALFTADAAFSASATQKIEASSTSTAGGSTTPVTAFITVKPAEGVAGTATFMADPGVLPNGSLDYIWSGSSYQLATASISFAPGGVKIVTFDTAMHCSAEIAMTPTKGQRSKASMSASATWVALPNSAFAVDALFLPSVSIVAEPSKRSVASASMAASAQVIPLSKRFLVGNSKPKGTATISIDGFVTHFHGYPQLNCSAQIEADTQLILAGAAQPGGTAALTSSVTRTTFSAVNAGASSTMVAVGYIDYGDAVIFEHPEEIRTFAHPEEVRTFNRPAT